MSNVNSSLGWVNLPAQSVTTTNATIFAAPAASALYQGLPSPKFPSGAGLYIDLSNTTQNSSGTATSTGFVNDLYDGHAFRVRVVGVATVGASSTFSVLLYNGSSSTTTSDTLVALSSSYTITQASSINFSFTTDMLWDSTTQKLNGAFGSNVNNTVTAPAAITSVTSLSVTNLQFCAGVIFGTSNAANTVTIKEFLLESL